MKPSKDNVTLTGFGMNCFSVNAPKEIDIDALTEFLKQSNACQRENIEYDYDYEGRDSDSRCYVFKESGSWKL